MTLTEGSSAAPSCDNHWLGGVCDGSGNKLSGELAAYEVGATLNWEFFGAINTDTSAENGWGVDYGVGKTANGSGATWEWHPAAWGYYVDPNRWWKSSNTVTFASAGLWYVSMRFTNGACTWYVPGSTGNASGWKDTTAGTWGTADAYFRVASLTLDKNSLTCSSTYPGPGEEQTFTVTGSFLDTNKVTVTLSGTAAAQYEIKTSSGSYGAGPLTLTPSSGSVNETISVRLKSTAMAGTGKSATITVVSAGLTDKTVGVTGSVSAVVPTVTAGSRNVGTTNAEMSLSVSSAGGTNLTADGAGVVYSLKSVNGTPTVGGSGCVPIAYSGTPAVGSTYWLANTAKLVPGATYAFRGYAANSVGTGYSTPAGEFTTECFDAPTVSSNGTPTSVSFTWNDVGATQYVLRVWRDFAGGGGTVTATDKITRATTGIASSTTYGSWSGKTVKSAAVYAGNNAGQNDTIQMRDSKGSGIVTTGSGGNIRRVSLDWGSTATERSLQIYGKHTAYSTATNLFSSSDQGTLLGFITNSATAGETTTNFVVTGDWEYVGVRSLKSTIYLPSVTFEWETSGGGGGSTTNYYGGATGAAATSGVSVSVPVAGVDYCWKLVAQGGGTCSQTVTGLVTAASGDIAPEFAEDGPISGAVVVGNTYAHTNAATGVPGVGYQVACTSGGAASGTFSVNGSGVFSFTPTLAGTYGFTVTATNGVSPDDTYSLTVTAHAGTPSVTPGAATSVTSGSARLPATVDAKGAETAMTFEWGTTDGSSYTGSVAVAGGDVAGHADHVGAAQTARDVYADLGGLIAGTTYFYKWTANNASGTNGTATGSFSTECFDTVPVVTTNTGSLSATLSWPRMDGADHYLVSMWTGGAAATDELNIENLGVTATGYSTGTFSRVKLNSDAYYAGQLIKSTSDSGAFQMRVSDGTGGIVSTNSGGTVSSIAVTGSRASAGTLAIYGSHTKYSAASELYNSETFGTLLTTVALNTSEQVVDIAEIGTYEYIGFKANIGTVYIMSLDVTWGGGTSATGSVNGAASGAIKDVVVAQTAAGVSPVTAAITSLAANTNAGYSWSVTAVGGGTCSAKTEGSGLKVEAAPAPRVGVLAGDPLAAVAAGSTDDWGTCEVWAGAVSKTYTVTNAGNATLATLNNATVTGDGFSGGTMGVNANLAAGGTTTFTVTFTPTTNMAAGVTKTGTVSFTHGAAGSPFTFQVTATVPAATISATPNTLDLVGTKGSAGAAKKFKPTGAHLTDEPVRLWFSGTNPTAFQIRGWPTNGTAAWSTYTNYARCWPVNGVVSLATNQVRLVKGLATGTYSATLMASGGGLSGDVLLVTINGTVYPKPVLAHNSAETSVVPGGTASLDFAAASGITNETCYSYKLTLPEGVTAAQTTFATNNGNLTYNPPASPPPYGTYAFDIAVTNSAGGGANFTWTVHVADAPTLTETVLPETTAVLAGTASAEAEVDAGGAATTVTFEYGTTEAYGTSGTVKQGGVENATVGAAATGAGNEATVTVDLAGLTPGTTYHYRWTVASVGGTNRVTGSFFVPGNGLEFPGGWNSWAQSGTTERDTLFGGGNYYATPALHLTGNHEFKAKKGDDWYGRDNKYWLPPNRAQDVGHDKSDMWAGGSSNQYLCVTETGGGFTPKGAGYYTLRGYMYVDGGGTKRVQYVAMFTENPPVTVTNGADNSASVGTGDVTVTAELSAAPSASEKVYVRYTTDGWATSALTNMTVSGTNVTGRIPGQGKGTTVEWYILTSPHEYVTNSAANAADLCTLRGLKSGGTNFCYTTAIAAPVPGTATAGYEQVELSWALNAAGQNVTIVRYDGTPAAGDITQPADGTAYADQATLVTGTTTGTVVYVNWNSTGVTNAAEQGKTYTYVFYSVNGDGAGIKYSEGASATLTATTMALATPTVSSASTAGAVGLSGANAARGEVYVVARTEGSGTFDGNPSGGLPGTGNPLCGGTVVYQGTTAGFNDSVIGCTTYNYKAWLKAADENAWSAGSAVRSMTAAEPGAVVVTGTTTNTDGFALSWTEADRADGYLISIWTGGETTVTNTDTLDETFTGVTGTSYTDWSGKTNESGAVWAGNSANHASYGDIQLRGGNGSGIYTTGSGGKVAKVTVVWNSGTSAGRFVDIYRKDTPYSSTNDLFSSSSATQGTLVGTISYGTNSTFVFTNHIGDTEYIGLRSRSQALYLDSITVEWETTGEGIEYVSGYGVAGGWVTNNVAIGGMDPGTDYGYALWAVGATTACAGDPTTNTVHTGGTAKPNPPGLSLSVTDAGTIAATVTRNNGEAWELWRFAATNLMTDTPPAGESAGVVRVGGGTTPATGDTTVTDTGLTGCTTYWYRAWEVNDPEGTPLWSNAREASATTPAPAAPAGLVVASTNAHVATLQWGTVAGANGYGLNLWHTGEAGWEEHEVTFEFITNSPYYSTTGELPAGSGATYALDDWVDCVDAGNTNTLTLTGWAGKKITGLSMLMRSWTNAVGEDAGRGSFTMATAGTNIVYVPDAPFSDDAWNGAWSRSWVTVDFDVSETVVGTGNSVTLTWTGTEDSLLFDYVTVTYETLESEGVAVPDMTNGVAVGESGVTLGMSTNGAGTTVTCAVSNLLEATSYHWSVAGVGGCTGAAAEGPDFETPELVVAPTVTLDPPGTNKLTGTVSGVAGATVILKRFESSALAGTGTAWDLSGTVVEAVETAEGSGEWTFEDTGLNGCKTYWYRAWQWQVIDGETATSPGSAPVSAQTLLAEPTVSAVGAGTQLTVNWSAVPGGVSYKVQISDTENVWTSTAGGEGAAVLDEAFAGFTANGGTDVSTNLNAYTEETGWTGSKVYCNSGVAKLGSSKAAGYLTTPSIAAMAHGGKVYFDLQKYSDSTAHLMVELSTDGGTTWTTNKTFTPTAEWDRDLQVALPATASAFKIRFETTTKQANIDNVRVVPLTEVEEGAGRGLIYESTVTSEPWTRTKTGLEIGSNYFYRVIVTGSEGCTSEAGGSATTADAPIIEVMPTHYNFGTVKKNSGEHTADFTVRNAGSTNLHFNAVALVQDGDAYSFVSPAAALRTAVLAAGESRTYTVQFNPTNSGLRTATLQFDTDAYNLTGVLPTNATPTYAATNITLTGTCFDPATADPEVLWLSVTDGLGVENTVWDDSMAHSATNPVLAVTAYHVNGMAWDAGHPTWAHWTLYDEEGNEVPGFVDKAFTSMESVPYDGKSCSLFKAPIPALGADKTYRGKYTVGVMLQDATRKYTNSTTEIVPIEQEWLLDDFMRADAVGTGGGALGNGWTARSSSGSTPRSAAIRNASLELYGPGGGRSGTQGRVAAGRDMSDERYPTEWKDFTGTGSWGFHFKTGAKTSSWNDGSTAGAFVLGATHVAWFTTEASQRGVAVMFTNDCVRLARFEKSLLASGTIEDLTTAAWTNGTQGKWLAVRVDYLPGQPEVDADESDDGQYHAAVAAKMRLYVKEVAGPGGNPVKECGNADLVQMVEVGDAVSGDLKYGGMVWNHGTAQLSETTGGTFDDIYVPHMDGQGEPMEFHVIDEDVEGPEFHDFSIRGAIAAPDVWASGLTVTGMVHDASGLSGSVAFTVYDGESELYSWTATPTPVAGSSTEYTVSCTIPARTIPADTLSADCRFEVTATDGDDDRSVGGTNVDAMEGTGIFPFTFCASAPTAPVWATAEADGAEMVVLRWARTAGTTYVVVRSDKEIGEYDAPQGRTNTMAVGTAVDGWGTVVYNDTGDNHLTGTWTAREFVVGQGSSNYFAVYGMTGNEETGCYFSAPTKPSDWSWTGATGNVVYATAAWSVGEKSAAAGSKNGMPTNPAVVVRSNSWPVATAKYEPGEGVDAFAYRTSVTSPDDADPAGRSLPFDYETRPETGGSWGGPWTGDTHRWMIHDGSLLTGETHYPPATANKLYWQDTSWSKTDTSASARYATNVVLTRPLGSTAGGDFFVAGVIHFQYPGPDKYASIALMNGETELVSFGKQGDVTDRDGSGDSKEAAIFLNSTYRASGTGSVAGNYALTVADGEDHIIVGQVSPTGKVVRLWAYYGGATETPTRIAEIFSSTNDVTTALSQKLAEVNMNNTAWPGVTAIRLQAGSDASGALGHVYFDEIRFASTWEELFLFNAPEVYTYDFDKPEEAADVSGVQVGTDKDGHRLWEVSDGALAHGDVGLTAQFGLFHRTGISGASFTIQDEHGTNLLKKAESSGTNTTAAATNSAAVVTLDGTRNTAYPSWWTTNAAGEKGGAVGVAMPTNWISLDSTYVVEVTVRSTGGKESTVTSASETGGAGSTDLFFGEYGEGRYYDKYVEIYNGTGQDVDLYDYYIFRPAKTNANDYSTSYTNLIPHGNYPFCRISPTAGSNVISHGETIVLLNWKSSFTNPATSDYQTNLTRITALEAALDARTPPAKHLRMTNEVLDSSGGEPYLLVKATNFNEAVVAKAAKDKTPVTLNWLDACGMASEVVNHPENPSQKGRYIMSRKNTATHLPRPAPMIIDTNEWDYRDWSWPWDKTHGYVDDHVSGFTNFIATAGENDRKIGLGGRMEFRVFDDDEEAPKLNGGGVTVGGEGLEGEPGDRVYVMGAWSFTNYYAATNGVGTTNKYDYKASDLTIEDYQWITEMWPQGMTTRGGLSWSPLLGGDDLEGYRNVIEAGSGKGQTGVEFDGLVQRGYGCMVAHASTNFAKTDEVWLGFDMDTSKLSDAVLSFGYAGGSAGFANARVEVSTTGLEGSFIHPTDWDFYANDTGGASTWTEWSGELSAAGESVAAAGHLWFRVVLKDYGTASGTFRMDNMRLEGAPWVLRVSDADLATNSVAFDAQVVDAASGLDADTASFSCGVPSPGLAASRSLVDGGKSASTFTWTKTNGFGRVKTQQWYTNSLDGKTQLRVSIADKDDDRRDDALTMTADYGTLDVYDDDAEPPLLEMTSMRPRMEGVFAEWKPATKTTTASKTMEGLEVGALGLCTDAGTTSKPRYSGVGSGTTTTYAMYQSGWQAESKYWTTTISNLTAGSGSIKTITFQSKVGSVLSPTGFEIKSGTVTNGETIGLASRGTWSLLTNSAAATDAWVKDGDTNTVGSTIKKWVGYTNSVNIPLAAAGTSGDAVEIRIYGKGGDPDGVGATWYLWDLTIEGEITPLTEDGEDGYTYVTDHSLAGGTNLTMTGSVYDEGSGLLAAPTFALTNAATGATIASGAISFSSEGELADRKTKGAGAFSQEFALSALGYGVQLAEYKGGIHAEDADNDRNSNDAGTGENYDSLAMDGQFAFTVVDQDLVGPSAPSNVTVNGTAVPDSAPNRYNVTWTNKPEFLVAFDVANDIVPTVDQLTGAGDEAVAWRTAHGVTNGMVKKASVQCGAAGVGEYRVSLATGAAAMSNAPAFSVAVTNGALANYGFERYADASWTNPDGDSGINKGDRVNVGTQEKPNLIYPVAEGTNSYYLRGNGNGAIMSQIIPFTASENDQTLTVDLSLQIYKRAAGSIVYAQFAFSADEANWTEPIEIALNSGSGASGDPLNMWLSKTMSTQTLTAAAGKKYLRFSLRMNGYTANIDDVRLSVRVGAAPAGGAADRATMRYLADEAGQGLNVKYLFAADADNNRPQDRRLGGTATFYTAYDITPPTKIGIAATNRLSASTDTVDDPTTQFDLTWPTDGAVGPDDPYDPNYQGGDWTGNNVLSPWYSYKIYYTNYDVSEVPSDDISTNNTKSFIYTNFIATAAYTNWAYVMTNSPTLDPTAPKSGGRPTAYDSLGVISNGVPNQRIRLYDLDFDQEYAVVIVGMDKAGNEGKAGLWSWATNNTIKFAVTQGLFRASADINAMLGTNTTSLANVGMSRIDTDAKPRAAVLYWMAAGMKNGAGEVKKQYDLIYRDAPTFTENGREQWKIASSGGNSGTSRTNWNYQADDSLSTPNRLRFYRASYTGRWQDTRPGTTNEYQYPLASEEVYSMNNVVLSEGFNYVSLQGVPWTNTFRGVFGVDPQMWPAATNGLASAEDVTRIEFYAPGTVAQTNGWYYFAYDEAESAPDKKYKWLDEHGDDVTDKDDLDADFFAKPFGIVLPAAHTNTKGQVTAGWWKDHPEMEAKYGASRKVYAMLWHPIMQVPTNGVVSVVVTNGGIVTTNGVFQQTIIASNGCYNLLSLNLPVSVHPSNLCLVAFGEDGKPTNAKMKTARNPVLADQLYVIDSATKEVRGGATMFCDTNGVWRYPKGTYPNYTEVRGTPIRPNDMLVLQSAVEGTHSDWTWTYSPTNFYTLPDRHMGRTPEGSP